MYHSDRFVINQERNPNWFASVATVVDLLVDVVPSRDGHGEFSISVFHTTCEMTVRCTQGPVLYHCNSLINSLQKQKIAGDIKPERRARIT